jgi:hypothetical protein
MTGRFLLALLKIVVVSVPIAWIWEKWGREAYGDLFLQLSLPIYSLFGYHALLPEGARDRFINYLPFLVLMIVTPRMSLTRRGVGIVVGFVVIFLFQVFFVWYQYVAVPDLENLDQQSYSRFLPVMLLCDSIPLILWIVIAKDFVQEITSKLFDSVETGGAKPPASQE